MKPVTSAGIMAAGRGFRLVGRSGSKAMFRVDGRPLIDYGLANLHAIGVERVVVIVRPDDGELIDYLERERRFPAVEIVKEDTNAALDSFILLNENLAGANYYILSCDVVAEVEDFRSFAFFSAAKIENVDMTIMVSGYVKDDRPIWVEMGDSGLVIDYGKDLQPTGVVFANVRCVSANYRIDEMDRGLRHLTEHMRRLVVSKQGRVYAMMAGRVLDVDSEEDLA